MQGGAGDVFHALHQLHQSLPVPGLHGRKAHAAVAHHRGGHAVPAGRLQVAVPGGLAVVVGVDVDETRRHQQAACVDLLAATAGHAAHGDDHAAVHRHVGAAQRAAAAVGQLAAADHQVMLHRAAFMKGVPAA